MESILSIGVLASVSILVSICTHKLLKGKHLGVFVLACVVAGLISSFLFQILGVLVQGYLDPFFIIAFVIGFFVAAVIAIAVGILQWKITKSK